MSKTNKVNVPISMLETKQVNTTHPKETSTVNDHFKKGNVDDTMKMNNKASPSIKPSNEKSPSSVNTTTPSTTTTTNEDKSTPPLNHKTIQESTSSNSQKTKEKSEKTETNNNKNKK